MKYDEALDFIYSRPFGKKDLGLKIIKEFLKRLSNPEKNLRFIHVAGTNGKGSVTMSLTRILCEAGYTVGSNTSPFIIDFRERIQLNNQYISKEDLIRLITYVGDIVKDMEKEGFLLSQFALIVGISILYFNEKNCDIVILETGIGGRYDPTNFIEKPLCSIITSISLDHENLIGNTIKEIAYEKAGIIKKNCDVIVGPSLSKEALDVIKKVSTKSKSRIIYTNLYDYEYIGESHYNVFKYKNYYYKTLFLGEILCHNFIITLNVINLLKEKGFNITKENEFQGILNCKIFGRMQKIHNNPNIILDGCHNEAGITLFCDYISKLNCNERLAFCSFSKDRNYILFLDIINKYFDKIFIIDFDNDNIFIPAKKIVSNYNNDKLFLVNYNDIKDIDYFIKITSSNDVIAIFGSLYLVSHIIKKFNIEQLRLLTDYDN